MKKFLLIMALMILLAIPAMAQFQPPNRGIYIDTSYGAGTGFDNYAYPAWMGLNDHHIKFVVAGDTFYIGIDHIDSTVITNGSVAWADLSAQAQDSARSGTGGVPNTIVVLADTADLPGIEVINYNDTFFVRISTNGIHTLHLDNECIIPGKLARDGIPGDTTYVPFYHNDSTFDWKSVNLEKDSVKVIASNGDTVSSKNNRIFFKASTNITIAIANDTAYISGAGGASGTGDTTLIYQTNLGASITSVNNTIALKPSTGIEITLGSDTAKISVAKSLPFVEPDTFVLSKDTLFGLDGTGLTVAAHVLTATLGTSIDSAEHVAGVLGTRINSVDSLRIVDGGVSYADLSSGTHDSIDIKADTSQLISIPAMKDTIAIVIDDSLSHYLKVDTGAVIAVGHPILKEGANMTLTKSATNDTITFAATGAGGTSDSIGIDTSSSAGFQGTFIYPAIFRQGAGIHLSNAGTDTATISATITGDSIRILAGNYIDTTTLDTIQNAHKSVLADTGATVRNGVIDSLKTSSTALALLRNNSVNAAKIVDQSIGEAEIDSTKHLTAIGYYIGTSAVADSLAASRKYAKDAAGDSATIGADKIAMTNINWTLGWIYLTGVYGFNRALGDSIYANDNVCYNGTDTASSFLLVDSAGHITAGARDTISVVGSVPYACTIDSLEMMLYASGDSGIVDVSFCGPDLSNGLNMGDSAYWTSTTNQTGALAMRAYSFTNDISATAGSRFRLKMITDFRAAHNVTRIGWVRIRVKR